ncbi:hypothetical protein HPP92_021327 [Vanilla planifolia]|uniref:Uncharacterized protein n=1 Tax=Vanilla planifolia TaxID=51239 RepID=A0A835UKL9_VANPL|nr:hypothetical protein HPP92_021327 [Vanilla planifolia]
MALGESLEFTPSWAVATVTAVLVSLSLLLEYSLHLISANEEKEPQPSRLPVEIRSVIARSVSIIFVEMEKKEPRVFLSYAVLRNLGFITLLLTIANHPMRKVCISTSSANTLLPCLDGTTPDSENVDEEDSGNSCSADGIRQLQTLMLMLSLSHVACSLLTLCLGQIKMRKWALWEQETNTLDHRLSVERSNGAYSEEEEDVANVFMRLMEGWLLDMEEGDYDAITIQQRLHKDIALYQAGLKHWETMVKLMREKEAAGWFGGGGGCEEYGRVLIDGLGDQLYNKYNGVTSLLQEISSQRIFGATMIRFLLLHKVKSLVGSTRIAIGGPRLVGAQTSPLSNATGSADEEMSGLTNGEVLWVS